jgi:hypothetical protein
MFRGVTALVGFTLLTAPVAHAAEHSMSLVQHNQVSVPYPKSYSKEYLAKFVHKETKAAPNMIAKSAPIQGPPPRPTVKLATQVTKTPAAYEQLARSSPDPESSPLIEAVVGKPNPGSSHAVVRIGFGKMVSDYSNTVGNKNGTRLEEPSVFYVKTSLNF